MALIEKQWVMRGGHNCLNNENKINVEVWILNIEVWKLNIEVWILMSEYWILTV